ncbi:hypothetical protein GGH18_005923, partial [Coemansia sp. RSA 530]
MRVALVALALVAAVGAVQHAFAPGPVGHVSESHNDVRMSAEFQPGSLYDSRRLIKVSEHVRARWMSLDAIL